MKRVFIFIGCLLVSENAVSYSPMADSLYIENEISSKKAEGLFKYAEQGIKKYQLELGYAYVFGGRFEDINMKRDIIEAGKWSKLSSEYPYSRYLLGRMALITKKGYNFKGKYGLSLIQSSCYEGVEDACVSAAKFYDKRYVEYQKLDIATASDEDNMKKAVLYYRKAIFLGENNLDYWRSLKDKNRIDIKKGDILDYQIHMAELLIKQKNKEGVSLLESLTYDSVDLGGDPLGTVYEQGEIVPRNLIKAYMYYDLGGNAYQPDKQRVAQKMSEEDINKAQELSWEWQEKHHSYREGYRNATDFPIQSHIIYK